MSEMKGKHVVITGATSGIGEAAARELARRGASLTLLARDEGRAAQTRRAIESAVPGAAVDFVLADLASLAEVRRAAGEILERCPRIDVLLSNAGLIQTSRATSRDGFELMFAVNHLAVFLLTRLLAERLQQTPEARVVIVASDAHKFARLDFDDLQSERGFSSMRVYGLSKLCNILFGRELARRLPGVAVGSLHPGGVATNMGAQNAPRLHRVLAPLMRLVMRSPEKGAETAVWLACAEEAARASGGYYMDCRERRAAPIATDDENARRLWEESERLAGLTGPDRGAAT